ncbi:tyrosine-type recombinase/integrase [Streptosporangium soli]|nr:tyrosine-type recombinase/integrase [Streptosporangium sp. KLBMP 9127]
MSGQVLRIAFGRGARFTMLTDLAQRGPLGDRGSPQPGDLDTAVVDRVVQGAVATVEIHPQLRTELQLWLDERPNWPHAGDNRALFLNAKGGRLTARAAGGIITEIAQTAGLDDPTTAHVLRHTLATTLVRGKTDLVLVAEILGHARLETTRRYSLPSDKDKEEALKLTNRIVREMGPLPQ